MYVNDGLYNWWKEYAEKDMTMVLPPDVAQDWIEDEFKGLFDGGDE